MSRIGRLAVLCGAAALAAGCGGGGGSLSREELATQADAICAKSEEELDQLAEPQSIEDVEQLAEEAKPIVQDGVDKLDELQPPEDLEDEYDRWIELNRENIDVIDELRDAAAEGDQERVQQAVQGASEKEEEADRLAGEIGLDQCAND